MRDPQLPREPRLVELAAALVIDFLHDCLEHPMLQMNVTTAQRQTGELVPDIPAPDIQN